MTRKTDSHASNSRSAAALKTLRSQIDKLDLQILKLVNERASARRRNRQGQERTGRRSLLPAREEEVLQNLCSRQSGAARRRHDPGDLSRDHERRAGTAEGAEDRLSRAGVQLQPSGRRRALRPGGRIHAGRQHRGRLRGGQPRPCRFRRRAAGELDRRPRGRHARHVHAPAAAEDLRRNSAADSSQPAGQLRAAEIRRVYSKAQALSQCRNWLSKNVPHAAIVEVSSTANAADWRRPSPGPPPSPAGRRPSATACEFCSGHRGFPVQRDALRRHRPQGGGAHGPRQDGHHVPRRRTSRARWSTR